ncbi:uncharacterized protein MYCGRDRAFT_94674 [Zymoseptoria tritici IPO323]|uniref:RING-type domain-containing protein n=1 Tax=Zymoseptoria tritici (strain CBS 115943 / IPO323) TaxID=336722 RepID=F9XGQ2_ZYMTI|nr:uncharacterized protein MYCGRDRAFT_94674 [Zymoseptoria tritici IPO323]EGP85801.1 hypothetical protein MYCGRDRAFT_94674 [Zymoseptoria tritici IPO323]
MTPPSPHAPSSDEEIRRNTSTNSMRTVPDESIPSSYTTAARRSPSSNDTPSRMTVDYPAFGGVDRASGTSLAPEARSFGYSRSQTWVAPPLPFIPPQSSMIQAQLELLPSSPHQRPTHRRSTGVAHTGEQPDIPRPNMSDLGWYGRHPQYTGALDIGFQAYHMGLAGFHHPTTRINQANSIVAHRPLYSRNDTHHQIVTSLPMICIPASSLPTLASSDNDTGEDSPNATATLARRQEAMVSDCLVCAQDDKSVWFETGCGHIACAEGMVRWLQEHRTCPSCRRIVVGEEIKLIMVDDKTTDEKDKTGS